MTTTVVLHGAGETGEGEDVTYDAAEHDGFPAELMLAGTWTLDDLSRRLDDFDLPDYRRWAFESAALDLGLRQAGTSLGEALGRSYRPVRFVSSTRTDIEPWLELDPGLEFKLDATKEWDDALMRKLAALDRVRVVDLKALLPRHERRSRARPGLLPRGRRARSPASSSRTRGSRTAASRRSPARRTG